MGRNDENRAGRPAPRGGGRVRRAVRAVLAAGVLGFGLGAVSGPGPGLLAKRPGTTDELRTAVDRLRRSEVPFRDLEVAVEDGIVYVRGSSPAADALAQAVARLPGVERVILLRPAAR